MTDPMAARGSDAKGFKGLKTLVTAVDIQRLAALSVDRSAASSNGHSSQSPNTNTAFQPPPKKAPPPQALQWALIVGGLLVLLAFCTHKGTSSNTPNSPADQTPAPSVAAPNDPSSSSAPSDPASSNYSSESKPDIGRGNILSEGEIRYCISEGIRLEAARAAIDKTNNHQIERFNTLIDDFNGRCSNYKYRQSDYDRAQQASSSEREMLVTQGEAEIQ